MFESSYTNADIVWTVRPPYFDTISLVILTLSLVLLTSARLFQHHVFSTTLTNTFKNYSFFTPINSGATISLFVNYTLISIGFSLILIKEYFHSATPPLWIYLIPLFLILTPFINYLLSVLFVGFKPVFKDLFHTSRNLILIKSFIFSLVLLLWVFNAQWSNYFKIILLGVILIFYLIRVVLSFRKSFNYSIRWYYLILYFCTLEILPYAFMITALVRFVGVKIV